MMKFYDLSQPIEQGMTFYPGDPKPCIHPVQEITSPWRVTHLDIGSHTGTHIDAPVHYITGGKSIDQYHLKRFVLPGMVLPVANLAEDQPVFPEHMIGDWRDFPEGGAILIQTEWDQYWKTEKYLNHPYLSLEAAQLLIRSKVNLVGIDALNVDSTVQSSAQVHRLLLENDILIVENLANLAKLQPAKLYQFSFLPLLLPGIDGSPVRAIAWEI
jgi:arylformamidase